MKHNLSKYSETKLRLIAFTLCNTFLKDKIRSRISLPASFSVRFSKYNISLVIFYSLTKFHWLVAFNLEDIEPGCDAINFKINLIFLIKSFFLLHDQKVKTQI